MRPRNSLPSFVFWLFQGFQTANKLVMERFECKRLCTQQGWKNQMFSRHILLLWASLHLVFKTCGGPRGLAAVTAVEAIVVLNQWNMYGPTILSCVMNITVGKLCTCEWLPDPLPKDLGP